MIKTVALGTFDGMHIAHQELVKKSDCIVVIGRGTATMTRGWKRSLYTNKEVVFYYLGDIRNLTAKEFISKLKKDFPNLNKIVVGYDFKFGKDRCGTIEILKDVFDGEVEVVGEIKVDNISVHARVIRDLIKSSNIKEANRLLGRNYSIEGKHIKGLGIGAKELVPTINLNVKNYTLPIGVFATIATINSKKYNSITFIGNRETIDNSFSVEVHILDKFNENIKGKIWIEFIDFIRDNRKFNSISELKEQIFIDIKSAKKILESR